MKDIYIIKNTKNNLVYIGQAKDVNDRWAKHISDANNRRNTKIAKAIYDIGVENFYYEILESNVKNADDREKYWIKYYDSIYPNGYNVAPGGVGVGSGVECVGASIKTETELISIVEDIKNSTKSFKQIAAEHSVAPTVISTINTGTYYRMDHLQYPLRETSINDKTLNKIFYSLKYERDKSIADIAKEYDIDYSVMIEINNGVSHHVGWQKYPVRTGRKNGITLEDANEIVDLLINSEMSQKDIARKYNMSVASVSSINKGRSFYNQNYDYPLRDNYQGKIVGKRTFTPNEIRELENLMKNSSKSLRDIAKEYECPLTTILNINKGSIKQYRNSDVEYPLRKIQPVSTTCV